MGDVIAVEQGQAVRTPFEHHFDPISTPFQPHFNPISTHTGSCSCIEAWRGVDCAEPPIVKEANNAILTLIHAIRTLFNAILTLNHAIRTLINRKTTARRTTRHRTP